jgi:hypothetical protein
LWSKLNHWYLKVSGFVPLIILFFSEQLNHLIILTRSKDKKLLQFVLTIQVQALMLIWRLSFLSCIDRC